MAHYYHALFIAGTARDVGDPSLRSSGMVRKQQLGIVRCRVIHDIGLRVSRRDRSVQNMHYDNKGSAAWNEEMKAFNSGCQW